MRTRIKAAETNATRFFLSRRQASPQKPIEGPAIFSASCEPKPAGLNSSGVSCLSLVSML
jgi:hypothetical protein